MVPQNIVCPSLWERERGEETAIRLSPRSSPVLVALCVQGTSCDRSEAFISIDFLRFRDLAVEIYLNGGACGYGKT